MIQTDAVTLARQIRTKAISPVAVVDAVLRRIEALHDRDHPVVERASRR